MMHDLLLRLRAALTPQTAILLAILLMVTGAVFSAGSMNRGQTALERRIGAVLSQTEGAGRVDVVIATRPRAQASGPFSASEEREIVCGAVAVAQGADDPVVRIEIQEALCALLGLPAASVSVVKGGG